MQPFFLFTGDFFHISSLPFKNFYTYDIYATKSFNCTTMYEFFTLEFGFKCHGNVILNNYCCFTWDNFRIWLQKYSRQCSLESPARYFLLVLQTRSLIGPSERCLIGAARGPGGPRTPRVVQEAACRGGGWSWRLGCTPPAPAGIQ